MSDKNIIDVEIEDELDGAEETDSELLNVLSNKIGNVKNNAIKKKSSNKRKKKQSAFVDIETIGGNEDNFVIVGNEGKAVKTTIKVSAKIIWGIIVLAALTTIVSVCLLFKATTLSIQGGNELFGTGIYVTPTSYVPPTNTLKAGDRIIVSNQNNLIPYLFNYDEYTYLSRSGALLTVADGNNKQLVVNADDVSYILK